MLSPHLRPSACLSVRIEDPINKGRVDLRLVLNPVENPKFEIAYPYRCYFPIPPMPSPEMILSRKMVYIRATGMLARSAPAISDPQ